MAEAVGRVQATRETSDLGSACGAIDFLALLVECTVVLLEATPRQLIDELYEIRVLVKQLPRCLGRSDLLEAIDNLIFDNATQAPRSIVRKSHSKIL